MKQAQDRLTVKNWESKNEWDGKKPPMAFFIEEEDVLLLTD